MQGATINSTTTTTTTLNRVSVEVSEVPKAEHTMKITHFALDAV